MRRVGIGFIGKTYPRSSFARNGHARLTLDLADVSFIDTAGIDLFRSLGQHDAVATNCSSFVTELLRGVLPCS